MPYLRKAFQKLPFIPIQKGNSISTNTVNQLCKLLDCPVSDVIEYINDES